MKTLITASTPGSMASLDMTAYSGRPGVIFHNAEMMAETGSGWSVRSAERIILDEAIRTGVIEVEDFTKVGPKDFAIEVHSLDADGTLYGSIGEKASS